MSLVVENLTKRFGEKTAVDHISFSMETPGVFGLLGTNGQARQPRSGQYWVSWRLTRERHSGMGGRSTERRWLSAICRRSAVSI